MCDLLAASEDVLLRLVIESIDETGSACPVRSEAAWRDSVQGLSDAVLQAVYGVPFGYAEGTVGTDPVVAFGMLRGRRHFEYGVDAAEWHELMRHHRCAFIQLVESGAFDEDDEEVCRAFLQGVFDRLERGFAQGYASERALEESRSSSRERWTSAWSIAEDAGGTVC